MTTTANRILLRGEYVAEEALANSDILPGNLIQLRSDGKVERHSTAGGKAERYFAIENALTGPNVFENGSGQTVATKYVSGDLVFGALVVPGGSVLAVLKAGYNYTIGTKLVSDGAGKLQPASALGSANVPNDIAIVWDTAKDLSGSGAVDSLVPVRLL